MIVPSFRPHKIRKVVEATGAYNAIGDYVPGGKSESDWYACRYEPNGSAQTISLQDGTNYQYHYTVYLWPDVPFEVEYGDVVELLSQKDESLGKFDVKGFHRYQLGLRIWL